MHKIYSVQADDRCYEDGLVYTLTTFADKGSAELLKQKIEQVFYYVEQRADKYYNKHPECYLNSVQQRIFERIKKNQRFKFLKEAHWSYWYNSGPTIMIEELKIYDSFSDYIMEVK